MTDYTKLDTLDERARENGKWRAPTIKEAIDYNLNAAPKVDTDEMAFARADQLGAIYLDCMQKAQRGVPVDMDEDVARAEACYFSKAMTGVSDVMGALWKKGGFPKGQGREYLAYMQNFFKRAPEMNRTPELVAFEALDENAQEEEAMKRRGTMDALKHLGGSAITKAMDFFNRGGNDRGLTREEEAEAPEEVRRASTMLNARAITGGPVGERGEEEYAAATKTVRDWRERLYRREVRDKHYADLLADNAWIEMSAIMPTLSENGQECAKAIMNAPDGRLPSTMYAKFIPLDDREKELLVRARQVMKPRTEENLLNVLGDMGVGFANILSSVATAPFRFGNKLGMMFSNKAFDAGFDIEKMARDRQYLWQVTGSFTAGGDLAAGALPQLQFEQFCDEHGFVSEALIGAVTTLPYMGAAAIPGVGTALVALQAMNELDDHVAMEGGDIANWDYLASSAIFGAMYAYTERLQLDGLVRGVTDRQIKEAFLKSVWKGLASVPAIKKLTIGTLGESIQEGLQNGLMSANEAFALKGDAVRAFGEGFVEDFIGSLGTMFVVEGSGLVGGHAMRSGFQAGAAGREARSLDLEKEYRKYFDADSMVGWADKREGARRSLALMQAIKYEKMWRDGGKDALIKAGVDPVSAEEYDYFFQQVREDVEIDEETGEARFDPRFERAQASINQFLANEAKKLTTSREATDEAENAFADALANLDWARSAWAEGNGIYRKEGDKTFDPGAYALEKLGFTGEVAARLSRQFHYERAAANSPYALGDITRRYKEATKGKVTNAAALAAQFGGSVVNIEGDTFLQFNGKDGSVSLVRVDERPLAGIDFVNDPALEGTATSVENATNGKVTKEQWIKATPEERRAIWEEYELVTEGYYGRAKARVEVSLSADPSVRVDSRQAATLLGTIHVDSSTRLRGRVADSSAIFHESYHAFSHFAEQSGMWTQADEEYLAKRFGKPRHSAEKHNEEAAAEGFRSFVARRASGAATAEDESSPFMKIYAAIAGIDAAARETAAKEKVASREEKAFFEQMIAEANKPKPIAPAPKMDLPKAAAPQKGIKKEAVQPEAAQPAPVATTPTAATQPAAKVDPNAPKVWSAYTPTGNVKVSGHWAIFDLKDVIHSNNPLYAIHMRAQLRNRKDNKAEEDARKDIVNNFQGERLLDAPDTANGAPIVFIDKDENGVQRAFVLSGNGRVLILNELAERHLYDRYRNVMKRWAADNGIAVPEGETPILVRVIDDYGGVDRNKVADLSNTNSIQQYTEEEQARADAEIIKSLNLARLYQANANGSPDMTPGVNDEFFAEFIRGVGDTSLYNSDRSLTQTAIIRAQRALLAIAVGQGDRGRAVVKKLVEQTETLGIERQKNAAAIMAAAVAALESNTAYAIGPDVSRAMADFMDYVEKKRAGKVGTFKDYFDQMDLLDKPSTIARELLKAFASDKAAATIAEYVKTYCRAATDESSGASLFGENRTRDEIWNDAVKFVDDIGRKAKGDSTEDAAAPTAKREPANSKKRDSVLGRGEVSLSAALDIPAQPQEKLPTYKFTVNTKKGPVQAELPPGGHNGLRGPYDPYAGAPESPRGPRSIFSHKVVRQLDPQGKYWGDKMPQFMGHKTEMFDRTIQTLREKMTPDELASYDTLVDYFGGGGSWGTSIAMAALPNVKRIIINEFDPGRAKKIELLQTRGEKIAEEAEKMLKDDGMMVEIMQAMKTAGEDGGESGSGGTLANVMIRRFKSKVQGDIEKLGLFYAITDCASRQLAGSRDVKQADGSTIKVKIPIAERWNKVMEQLAKDGKNATAMRQAFEKRGGKVEYVTGDSTKNDFGIGFKTPHGKNVMAVTDPPYYRTEGYSDDGSSWKVGLESAPNAYAYADTQKMLQRLMDYGDGIVYTDEAWWLKPEYLSTHAVIRDGLLDDGAVIAAQREYRREHQILTEIRDTFDHFDVAGEVAGRYETLGVQHGHDQKSGKQPSAGNANGAAERRESTGPGSEANGRPSVRRMAGGAEGEDGAVLRNGGKSGQRSRASEEAVREIYDAVEAALPPTMRGYPGQSTTAERIIRASVRSVREDKQKAYAKTVAKNVKAYLARTAKQLDARMKAAGYTEKVWHGTGAGQFSVFRLATREESEGALSGFADDGIKMAFFAYYERTAQNYAALSSFDIDTDYETLMEGAKPDVREYYVNPGKCLELDEAKWPQSYQQWTQTLKKAWEDGYDSVKLVNALDDQGVKLIEDPDGTERMEWPNEDELGPKGTPMEDNSASFQTDILVVFDHGEKNPGANRIKAADPVTFWDEEHGELPIPLEMRANRDFPDLRFSVQMMGKKAKEEARKAIEKYRPELGKVNIESADQWRKWRSEYEAIAGKKAQDEEYSDTPEFEAFLFDKRTEMTIAEIEKFPTPKARKAALYWFCLDSIRLPEDAPKVEEALKTAEKAKVDPLQYEWPVDILEQFEEYRPKEKPIDPDTVPELSDKREMGHGIVTYLVQDDKAGQLAMRKIVNTHFGKNASPWCILQADQDGNLTRDAWEYWEKYNALPKRVAFKNGKLVAFMATDESVLGGYEEAELRYEEAIEDGAEIPDKEAWIREQLGQDEKWWDRTDVSHDGIPFTEKDAEGRTLNQELLLSGKIVTTKISKGNPNADGIYEEWNLTGENNPKYRVVTERRNGVPYKATNYYANGIASMETLWPDRKKTDSEITKTFYEDGTPKRIMVHFPDGRNAAIGFEVDGMFELVVHEADRFREEAHIVPGDKITKESISIVRKYIDANGRHRTLEYEFRNGTLTELNYENKELPVNNHNRLYLPELNAKDIANLIETSFKAGEQIAPLTQIASTRPQRYSAEDADGTRYSIHSAWVPEFPKAVAQTTRKSMMDKYADLFNRAKAGDVEAAADLIEKVVKVEKVKQLGKDHPNAKIVAPVLAMEATGHNQLPRMYAEHIASILGIEVADGIVQAVRANHTGADAERRLFAQPEFTGPVEAGAEYIIVDDHITQGGTINALRDHIEMNGGKVVAVSALTLSKGSSILSPKKETLDELKTKWPDIDQLLRAGNIADSAEALTESQARYILKFSPDTFRNRATAQGIARGRRVREEALGASQAAEIAPANERELSPENAEVRYSMMIGARGGNMANGRLLDAIEMSNGVEYDDDTRKKIYIKTGWWKGVDGRWRFEIAHPQAKRGKSVLSWDDATSRYKTTVGDLINAPALFKAYPPAKDVEVYVKKLYGSVGEFVPEFLRINLDESQFVHKGKKPTNHLTDEGLDTLVHELQHLIQHVEGFAQGGSVRDVGRANYRRLAGEVEARNAEFRNWGIMDTLSSPDASARDRKEALELDSAPWQTEDVSPINQILLFNDGKMTDRNGRPINDPEADARASIIRSIRDDEDKSAAENALENYVAYFKLSHGSIPRARTLARLGLSLGMTSVDPKRILNKADKLAARMKGTLIEQASKAGDVASAMAMIQREKNLDKRMSELIAGGVGLGGELTHKGVGQVNALLQRRIERMMNSFDAATLADMEGDTGLDLAAEILENNPEAFETEYRKARAAAAPEGETAEQQAAAGTARTAAPLDEREMSDADRYKRAELLKEQAARVAQFIENAKARAQANAEEAAARREKARANAITGGTGDGEGGTGDGAGESQWTEPLKATQKAGFKTPEEFAAFMRLWAADRFAKTHGLTTIARAQQDKLFDEFYRICVRQELGDLADKLLAPKMWNEAGEYVTNSRIAKLGNGARVWVNRRLQELEKGIRADTIERMSADIFAFINKAAVRVSRVDLITEFKKELKLNYLKDPEFDEFKEDTERKVTGWVEEATRYILRVCDLSKWSVNGDPSQLEQEYNRLHAIIDERAKVYDESGHDVAEAAKEDAETRKAMWKLALLDKYGAMRTLMPGQILDLQRDAYAYLDGEAKKLEEMWRETRAQQDQVRSALSAAIVGPNGQRYQEKGMFTGRLFDALNGLLRLRLKHLTRFAGAEAQAKANDAINSVMIMLGDGEVAYAKALQEDRAAFFAGLGKIFQRADGTTDNAAIKKYLERMDTPIPTELARQISQQGYAGSMTYGQMLQLLVSLEQRSFKEAIVANGREGQADLIRTFRYLDENGKAVNAFTQEDAAFVGMLRAFYEAKRDQLSAVTERMVGQKVDSPDPLYCPIRRLVDDRARALHVDSVERWDPISRIFARRVPSLRDFDESRTIVGLFFENSKESAKLTAWAERGSFIRNVVTSVGFQSAVTAAFGKAELGKILKQLEATFNGGERRSQTPGEVAAADKAVNFVTYAYLGFNPLSALKQTTSAWVWANVLDGGFADLWRHMTHFDPKVLKHLMESDEYKVRYGDEVGAGMDYATKGLNLNPSENSAMRVLKSAGMWMLKKGDFIPGGWVAQGVYKDLLDKHMREGMEYEAADKQAITETFNLLEETQQSGRTYNTNMLQIEHGRIGRLLTQFATSPLQQLQYETQAWREWRDMVRYDMGEDKIAPARQRFYRAVFINHVLMPAAMNLVIAMYKAAVGEEPPWEKDGYHWSLLIDLVMGQFSRVFFLGAFAQTTLAALFKREAPRAGQMLPIEGAFGMATSGAFLVHDLVTMDYDKVQKDIERAIKSTAPTRLPYNLYRRVAGSEEE